MGLFLSVPCTNLFATSIGSEGRRRSREEEDEEALKRKHLQEEHLSKVSELISSQQVPENHTQSSIFNVYLTVQLGYPHVFECMHLCVDSVWFGEAHSEGGDGKRADQGASCT